MKAAIFEKPGFENLQIKHNLEESKLADYDVLIKVRMCGVNPIDHMVASGVIPVKPLPHIPGCEIAGTVERRGDHVDDELNEEERVIAHSRVFDGTCDMCLRGHFKTRQASPYSKRTSSRVMLNHRLRYDVLCGEVLAPKHGR